MTNVDQVFLKTGFVYNLFVFRKRVHSPDIKMSAKKLINNVDHVVDEALEGLVKSNPGVNLIENHRVVVRSDLENLKDAFDLNFDIKLLNSYNRTFCLVKQLLEKHQV